MLDVDNAQINVLTIDAHTCSDFCILMPPNLNAYLNSFGPISFLFCEIILTIAFW